MPVQRGAKNAAREKWCDPCKNNRHTDCLQERYENSRQYESLPSGDWPAPSEMEVVEVTETIEYPYGACDLT